MFVAIGELRKEARTEIDRLIGFLDKTDDYVPANLKTTADQGDQSYPEGARACTNPHDDDEDDDAGEDDDPAEPSLGSSNDSLGRGTEYTAVPERMVDCEHDPADRPLEVNEDDDGNPDDEPSLGWTIDGVTGDQSGDDREQQNHSMAPVVQQKDGWRDRRESEATAGGRSFAN